MTTFELSVLFFLQLGVILAACRLVGVVMPKVGQPPVVSEMVTGVVLGPSVFGALLPTWQAALFPAASMPILFVIAQLGLALYMFLVGVEFRTDLFRQRVSSAVSVSTTGIVVPFCLGALIAIAIHADGTMFGGTVTAAQGALYLGAAMSITAFPMLARIVHERGLSGTSLGTLALAAGAIDDAVAWCVLAIVLASLGNAPAIAVAAIAGGVLYALAVLLGLRPALAPLARQVEHRGAMSSTALSVVLVLVMLGSWFTDRIGIYSVFGAFVLGTVMPRGFFADELQRLLAPLTTGLLLPIFFVYSGLNTKVGLISTPHLAGVAALVLVAACVGKGVACWLAARLNGEPPRQAMAIGALMNTRGLMELIALNIGYERGIITQTLFSIMVLMALATTLMATPLFELAYGRRGRRAGTVGPVRSG
jgi:Kef-type K+ transport system membrane component KefB